MDCGYKEKTILFFYGELPVEIMAETGRHIKLCPDCAGALAVLRGLSEQFNAFRPRVPELDAEALVSAARGTPLPERLFSGFRRAALAGAFTAMFLLIFQAARPGGGSVGWRTDLDSRLDDAEYSIYALRDEMVGSSAPDFDYSSAEIEDQKWRII
ncbi:MAG: hypothetical protein A2X28_04825 [Elusimicrobia bacterium GWA2_56_46]|nr:MAG: hypothetical protein A2X28_04825 [Elusimicrobia bacterium GWA2_56_46]OGR56195.1 MAG: hypothetical protein A2X39_08245 [Elusimicrobia bacterium GWC2_56_31]HBB66912.1 hypothetical protein [Elusimicrobiota bacterium]HBW23028.1 hypothetical protein [Elusimicrobiota bacterium]